MGVQPLGGEDHLGEGMATYSSMLAWEIPGTEEPGGLSPWGRRESSGAWLKRLSPRFDCEVATRQRLHHQNFIWILDHSSISKEAPCTERPASIQTFRTKARCLRSRGFAIHSSPVAAGRIHRGEDRISLFEQVVETPERLQPQHHKFLSI